MIYGLFILYGCSLVIANEYKQYAIILGLSNETIPTLSEQILLKKFKDELDKNYDFRFQSEFEITLQKIKGLSNNKSCNQLRCILKAYSEFKQTNLFLINNFGSSHIMSVIMIEGNNRWIVKHEICPKCELNLEQMMKNILYRLEISLEKNIEFEQDKFKSIQNPVQNLKEDFADTKNNINENDENFFNTDNSTNKKTKLKKEMSPLDELQFKISQRRYNQLIWKKIKKELMFFRRKSLGFSIKKLKARIRLQIDRFGKIIGRSIVDRSGSDKFDKTILETVDILKLPPPMKNLIKNPPYVVTILIQP